MSWILSLFHSLLLLSGVPLSPSSQPSASEALPQAQGHYADAAIRESSGLCRSRSVAGRFWSLNDSGNAPVLYAHQADGTSLAPGQRIKGVSNIDWEALAADDEGHLWIIDLGNNLNQRKNLQIHEVKEPLEAFPGELTPRRSLKLHYPDQQAFPPEKNNFDCEAALIRKGVLYLFTKHRADKHVTLYRLRLPKGSPEASLPLEKLQEFQNLGQATGAALHPDGKQVALLSYDAVHLLRIPDEPDQPWILEKSHRWPHWSLKQSEAIAWISEDELLISNESGSLFTLSLK